MLQRCLKILLLALPVMVSQIGYIIVSFADNIMVGHYSTQALASSSFVVNIFNIVTLCGMGFSYGLTPLVGALFSKNDSRQIGLTIKAGLIANVVVGVLLSAAMAIVYFCIPYMGQPEELLPLIRPFFLIYLAGLIPMAVFNTFVQWSYAVRNTAMPMWILLMCNTLNIIGNYLLIYGHYGFPELGLTGAGLSTLFVRYLMAVAIVAIFFLKKSNRPYRDGFLAPELRISRQMMTKVISTSWPVALQLTCETAAFSTCAVFAGWLGTIDLAAFQIIIVVGSLGFCIYYSIGTAIAVEVANEAGRSDLFNCRRIAFSGYAVMLVMACISSTVFICFAHTLIGLFTNDPLVLAAAQTLLVPLLLYQLGDATQITFANALRGTSHVMPMLWIAFFSYVVVGLSSTWVLAFPVGLGNYGIVLSFSVSLFMAAFLFLRSFLHVTRRHA